MDKAELKIVQVPTEELVEYDNNAKLHPAEQIDQIEESIKEFGFNSPILAWHNDAGEPEIIAGHGRLRAAKKIGLDKLPVVFLDHLTDEQRRAYVLVDNQLTMNSGFDDEILAIELEGITDIDMAQFDFDISLEGFDPSFEDAEDESEPDEEVTVKVLFHDPDLYQTYRDMFSKMEKDGASVSIS